MSKNKKSLLTVGQFRELARPTSLHLDEGEVSAFIREAEDAHIIPSVGYRNFKAAVDKEDSVFDKTFDTSFQSSIMLDGGEWTDKKGELRYCSGLRKALAYYTYAKLLRSDGAIITRSGTIRHRDEEADHEGDDKLRRYNDTTSMAERYLSEVLEYLSEHRKDKRAKPIKTTRARIRAIGD